MGRDKALIELGGEPLIARAIATLRGAGVQARIAGARLDLSAFAPMVGDAGEGPLGGICAALASLEHETAVARVRHAVFLSVDAPFIPSSLVLALLQRIRISDAAVVAASVGGCVETFPFVLDCALRPALEAERRAGNTGCLAALRGVAKRMDRPFAILPVEELVQAGQVEHPSGWPPSLWFMNLNTPQDLARGEVLMAGHRVS
jgi:molybdenum cofactor guanylyltransferase